MISFKIGFDEELTFVWCPPGRYTQITRGTSLWQKTGRDTVEVIFEKGFWMSNTSVTNGQWKGVMGEDFFEFGTFSARTPVYAVDLQMVLSFIDRLNTLELKSGDKQDQVLFSLPNFMQMRYGCFSRILSDDPFFWDVLGNATFSDFAWYKENSNGKIHEVGLKKPSPWGLYDMFGNILEMSADVSADSGQSIFVDPISTMSNNGFMDAVGGDYNQSMEECISPINQSVGCVNEYIEPYGFRLVFQYSGTY
jgi:formylglycine-generating enzyme required for sulfatase activity